MVKEVRIIHLLQNHKDNIMKIVHVCLCGTFGEDYAYQDNLLPKYHHKMGHEVTIVAPIYCRINTQTGEEEIAPCGIKLMADGTKLIRLAPLVRHRINIRLHLFKGLYKILLQEAPNLLFVHGIDSLSYRECIKYAKKHPDVILVLDNHADWNNSYHSKISYYWAKYVIKRLIVKPALKTAKQFYGVTPARCTFLNEMYGIPKDRIKLLPFGADDDELKIESKQTLRKTLRNQYNIRPIDFLIVTGGKIDKRKNIHLVAEAVLRIKNPNLKLLIFGAVNNEMKDYFSSVTSDRIIMTGWVPSNDVYKYFYAADFVMFPGLHSVLWEQMLATRTPCACTKIDGFEHMNYNDNCILMESNTIEYYMDIINRILNDSEYYKMLCKNSDTVLANQFKYSKIAQQILDDINIGE